MPLITTGIVGFNEQLLIAFLAMGQSSHRPGSLISSSIDPSGSFIDYHINYADWFSTIERFRMNPNAMEDVEYLDSIARIVMRYPNPNFIEIAEQYRQKLRGCFRTLSSTPKETAALLETIHNTAEVGISFGGFGYTSPGMAMLNFLEEPFDVLRWPLAISRLQTLINSIGYRVLRDRQIETCWFKQLCPDDTWFQHVARTTAFLENILTWWQDEWIQDPRSIVPSMQTVSTDPTFFADDASDISDDNEPMRNPTTFHIPDDGRRVRRHIGPRTFRTGGFAGATRQQMLPLWLSASRSILHTSVMTIAMAGAHLSVERTTMTPKKMRTFLTYLALPRAQRARYHTMAEGYFAIRLLCTILFTDANPDVCTAATEAYAESGLANLKSVYQEAMQELAETASIVPKNFVLRKEGSELMRFSFSPKQVIEGVARWIQ